MGWRYNGGGTHFAPDVDGKNALPVLLQLLSQVGGLARFAVCLAICFAIAARR